MKIRSAVATLVLVFASASPVLATVSSRNMIQTSMGETACPFKNNVSLFKNSNPPRNVANSQRQAAPGNTRGGVN